MTSEFDHEKSLACASRLLSLGFRVRERDDPKSTFICESAYPYNNTFWVAATETMWVIGLWSGCIFGLPNKQYSCGDFTRLCGNLLTRTTRTYVMPEDVVALYDLFEFDPDDPLEEGTKSN